MSAKTELERAREQIAEFQALANEYAERLEKAELERDEAIGQSIVNANALRLQQSSARAAVRTLLCCDVGALREVSAADLRALRGKLDAAIAASELECNWHPIDPGWCSTHQQMWGVCQRAAKKAVRP